MVVVSRQTSTSGVTSQPTVVDIYRARAQRLVPGNVSGASVFTWGFAVSHYAVRAAGVATLCSEIAGALSSARVLLHRVAFVDDLPFVVGFDEHRAGFSTTRSAKRTATLQRPRKTTVGQRQDHSMSQRKQVSSRRTGDTTQTSGPLPDFRIQRKGTA